MEKGAEEKQPIKVEEVSPEKMNLEQERRAEQLYQQLGLEPVVDRVLKEFAGSLSGFERVTDRAFGPYDIKGRAKAIAKVTALVAYVALDEQYGKEMANLNRQIASLEAERNQVRTNYDRLVQKVSDIVRGDYDELKTNYNQLVERLANVEPLRSREIQARPDKERQGQWHEKEAARRKAEQPALFEL